jgi:hypothetical protein
MTTKEAEEFAGRSARTLSRYKCDACGWSRLVQLQKGCGSKQSKCNPLADNEWPPLPLKHRPAPKCEGCGSRPESLIELGHRGRFRKYCVSCAMSRIKADSS